MQFIFFQNAGNEIIEFDGEIYNYIFKVRRHKINEIVNIRSSVVEHSEILYKYKIIEINKRSAKLELIDRHENFEIRDKKIVAGWCITDSQTIEKNLPALNELGVDILYLIKCQFSQGDFRADFDRYSRILQSSSMQCGRYDFIKIYEIESINKFIELFPDSIAIDFSENKLSEIKNINNISLIIGPEGGFHANERESFKNICGLNSKYILKSSTAIISAVSKIL